jgi:hypothetical protein
MPHFSAEEQHITAAIKNSIVLGVLAVQFATNE